MFDLLEMEDDARRELLQVHPGTAVAQEAPHAGRKSADVSARGLAPLVLRWYTG